MKKILVFTLMLATCVLQTSVFGAPFNNDRALQGISQAKVVFDINVGEPKLLLTRMKLLDATYQQLKAAGVKAEFVLAFRGKASFYITRDELYLDAEEKENKAQMRTWIKQFSALGFRLEQCALAAEMLKINTADFLPEVQVVQNGYISLIGYQHQGYAFVPMD